MADRHQHLRKGILRYAVAAQILHSHEQPAIQQTYQQYRAYRRPLHSPHFIFRTDRFGQIATRQTSL